MEEYKEKKGKESRRSQNTPSAPKSYYLRTFIELLSQKLNIKSLYNRGFSMDSRFKKTGVVERDRSFSNMGQGPATSFCLRSLT